MRDATGHAVNATAASSQFNTLGRRQHDFHYTLERGLFPRACAFNAHNASCRVKSDSGHCFHFGQILSTIYAYAGRRQRIIGHGHTSASQGSRHRH